MKTFEINYLKPPQWTPGGFCVMLNEMIYILSYLEHHNIEFIPHFNWKNELFQDEHGHNVFDYYFHNNPQLDRYDDYISNLDNTYNPILWNIDMNAANNFDQNKITRLHNIFNKYIKIKLDLIPDINIHGKSLGIQYRYTDKLKELIDMKTKQIDPSQLIQLIKSTINKYDTIYLSTDYKPIIDEISGYSDKIKYINCARSDNMKGVHFQTFDRESDNYLKGLECLIDIVMLSRCEDIYYSRSNVSLSAVIINGGKYGEMKLINNL